MKLIDYLAKRKRYKELKRQLEDVELCQRANLSLSCEDLKTATYLMEKNKKYKKQIDMLNEELKEVFKDK